MSVHLSSVHIYLHFLMPWFIISGVQFVSNANRANNNPLLSGFNSQPALCNYKRCDI